MADAAKAIDEVLARRATPQLPQPAPITKPVELKKALSNAGIAEPEF